MDMNRCMLISFFIFMLMIEKKGEIIIKMEVLKSNMEKVVI
jgi:hypothetical protein